jgi:hypothetical protein
MRERIIKADTFSDEVSVPLLAPSWARAGYEGYLKYAVIKACNLDNEESHNQQPENDVLTILSKTYGDDEYDADIGEEGNEEEEVVVEVLLTSGDQSNNDQYSDDDHLEMND